MSLSPSWAMSGQAIDGRDDTHLAPGNHLRIVTNPLLGLPVCPIVVQRVVTTRKQLWLQTRSDAVWVDSHGTVLTPPFTLTADNPVTAYLPRPACWVEVAATPSRTSWWPPVVGLELGGQLPGALLDADPPGGPPLVQCGVNTVDLTDRTLARG